MEFHLKFNELEKFPEREEGVFLIDIKIKIENKTASVKKKMEIDNSFECQNEIIDSGVAHSRKDSLALSNPV